MAGSSHSYQRALHCLADLRTSSEEMRAHWFRPYLWQGRTEEVGAHVSSHWCAGVVGRAGGNSRGTNTGARAGSGRAQQGRLLDQTLQHKGGS